MHYHVTTKDGPPHYYHHGRLARASQSFRAGAYCRRLPPRHLFNPVHMLCTEMFVNSGQRVTVCQMTRTPLIWRFLMEIVAGVKLTAPPLHRLWYIFLVRRVALIQSGNVQSIKTYCIVLPDSLDGKCIHSTMHQATPALSGDVSIYPLTTALSLMRIHMKRVEKTGIFHRTIFSAQFRI